MSVVMDRVDVSAGEPVLRGRGVAVAEVLEKLEAGEAPDRVAEAMGLEAADLVSALAFAGLGADEDDGPPLLRARPARPRLEGALGEAAMDRLLPRAARPVRLALAAGLLQALDFWEASHEAAQRADDLGERSASPYWHAIAHRREPDPGNAAYWFRRVGRHPAFEALARAARPLIEEHGDADLWGRLVRGGAWDPSAMIDLCTSARPGTPLATLARRIQRLEMIALLDETAALAGAAG